MSRTFTSSEVTGLLDAFDRLVREGEEMARVTEREATKHLSEAYARFRRKLSETDALALLVEERLANVQGGRNPDLDRRYVEAGARAMMMQVRASLRFFYVLSANTYLPLGSRDIFLSELARLEQMEAALSDPRFEPHLEAETVRDLATARDILTEIADKAPGLMSLARQHAGVAGAVA
jgi:hypothetical protein